MAGRKFSCYLDDEMVTDLDKIAEKLELSRNKVIRMACRLLVKRVMTCAGTDIGPFSVVVELELVP